MQGIRWVGGERGLEAQIPELVPDQGGVGADVSRRVGGGTIGLDIIVSMLIIHQATSFKHEPQAPLFHPYSTD